MLRQVRNLSKIFTEELMVTSPRCASWTCKQLQLQLLCFSIQGWIPLLQRWPTVGPCQTHPHFTPACTFVYTVVYPNGNETNVVFESIK